MLPRAPLAPDAARARTFPSTPFPDRRRCQGMRTDCGTANFFPNRVMKLTVAAMGAAITFIDTAAGKYEHVGQKIVFWGAPSHQDPGLCWIVAGRLQ